MNHFFSNVTIILNANRNFYENTEKHYFEIILNDCKTLALNESFKKEIKDIENVTKLIFIH